jgi:UDP-4-amino-4,6-dideoxy-N-acetyl-beta-L-altrosamine N-acetyltransferase
MVEVCTVRLLSDEDLPMVLTWRNHPAVRKFMLTQHEIGMEEHSNWFARVKDDKTQRQLIACYGGDPIGFVQFTSVLKGGIANWGFYARPGSPAGSGRKLGQTALTYAFQSLGLHKVCGQAVATNLASIRFHQMLGFAEEGFLLNQRLIGGQHHKLVCFGLLAKDWRMSQQTQDNLNAAN